MGRIQLTTEISHSLGNLRKRSGNSNLGRVKGFHFGNNKLNGLERYATVISTVSRLLTHYRGIVQTDVQKAENLIQSARDRDQAMARKMEGTLS